MKDGIVKIGCCSPKIRVCDFDGNADKIISKAFELDRLGVRVASFPELCITGYTSGDLFNQTPLLTAAETALDKIIRKTASLSMLFFVGLPVAVGSRLYNCAAAVCSGKLCALIPKTNIANYSEFYEKRYFSSAPEDITSLSFAGRSVPFGQGLLLECENMPGLVVGAELCEDLWVPSPPSTGLAIDGATVLFNLSCSDETIGKDAYRREMIRSHSGRLLCAYAYASAGEGESTSDLVYAGHCAICENGELLAEQRWESDGVITADVDVQRLLAERRRITSFGGGYIAERRIGFSLEERPTVLNRYYSKTPFVPSDRAKRDERCEEILTMQSRALSSRLEAIGAKTVVVGLSGGLDSTLALIVCVRTFDHLSLDRKGIIAITMPCFGTTNRTRSNASMLAEAYGVTLRSIPINEAVTLHLRDIGHDGVTTDVTYENTQARERTQILMDTANLERGIVIGTGDLSEMALGWSTYNGDHMSMYGVNCGIPKTLVRYIVSYEAARVGGALSDILLAIYHTPVSPELLPPKDGDISQRTEEIVGPYELHDFYLYHFLRFGFSPQKIYRLAMYAFGGEYDGATIKRWLITFIRRFFSQQFKRNCIPDGPKIGSVALSPRGDWRMPSDSVYSEWLRLAEQIDTGAAAQ